MPDWRLGVVLVAAAVAATGCGQATSPRATPAAGLPTATAPAAPGAAIPGVATPPPGAAESGLLQEAWQGYRSAFIQGDGRVVDPERGGVSTSEGQSYAMLRAVWSGDRTTFDHVWRWTQDNLGIRETGLFGYLWGDNHHGAYTLLSRDSAADADEDIGFALLLASRRWADPGYLAGSRGVLASIWAHDVATAAGLPFLSAGSWAPGSRSGGLIVDPSYMAPYEYRLFAAADPAHPWTQLVATAYAVVTRCSAAPLSTGRSAGLPPNWCAVADAGGVRAAPRMSNADTYGYDAFRTMWRIGVDVLWNNAPEGRAYLAGQSTLLHAWSGGRSLASQYSHDGRALGGPDPTVAGGDIGAFLVADPAAAHSVLQDVLLASYSHDGAAHFGDPHNYYEQNWVWFGIALAYGAVQSEG
ncbi:MAG TPA: glycosyl hydrolase family 8 [Candidatus Dormibacteraeota bacterium]|nr:glycosyl hydrolase family 8 [Candidatus Dormibacteraeota bacterium]